MILRAVVTLWLPRPRRVHMFLDGLRKYYYSKLSIDDRCLSQNKNTNKELLIVQNYPYIRRICDEYFMLNNMTTLYVLKINNNELIEMTP